MGWRADSWQFNPKYESAVCLCRLALVDAFAILFRTHHAYGSVLKDRNGKPTSIVYGFVKDIITLMELTPRITHWAIVFDFSGKNFRQAAPLQSWPYPMALGQ